MAATQLSIYNGALRMCGERKLASLTEAQQGRYLLDDEWADGAVDYCLGQGPWRFARRTVELTASTTVTPDFGYSKAFALPDDFIRTVSLCVDPHQQVPLTAYAQEQAYWFADVDTIYVTYVSNDANYGGNMSRWADDFVLLLQSYLASKIVETLTQDAEKWKRVFQLAKKYRNDLANSTAMEGPTRFLPTGSWARARGGAVATDRGSRSKLVG